MVDPKKTRDDANGFDPLGFAKRDPQSAALISKLVPDPRRPVRRDNDGNRQLSAPQNLGFKNKLARRAKKNNDSKLQQRMLPDTRLAGDILISSILSPGDMVSSEVTLVAPKHVVTSDLATTLTQTIKEYLDDEYNLQKHAPEHLKRALMDDGSCPVVVIPENVIDDFINSSGRIGMESFKDMLQGNGTPIQLGILGRSEGKREERLGFGMEMFKEPKAVDRIEQRLGFESDNSTGKVETFRDEYTIVSDNPVLLRLPQLSDIVRTKKIREIYNKKIGSFSIGFEADEVIKKNKVTDFHLETAIQSQRRYKTEIVSELPRQSEMRRKSVSKPVIISLPSESVLPVFVPGNPEKHVGYFLILDEEGNPIKALEDDFLYRSTGNNLNSSAVTSLGSNIIQRVNTNIGNAGRFDAGNRTHMDFAFQIYSEILERDLIARVKNGVYGRSVNIANNEEIARVMLSRTLAKKFTQILFVPIDYLTYIAFDYDDDGVGVSLMDEGSMINTMRSVTMFTDLLASIKNSIGRSHIQVTIDEADPDPEKTIAMAKDVISRSRRVEPPTTVSTPLDITDFLNEACIEWEITGDHPGLPKMSYNIDQKQTSYPRVDSDLKEDLKKHSIQLMGLTPEQVDNGLSGEFATTIVANNILLSKRVVMYQNKYTPQLSKLVRIILHYSSEISTKLTDLLTESFDQIKLKLTEDEEYITRHFSEEEKKTYLVSRALQEFVENLDVTLPKPPSVTLEAQIATVNTYKEGLDLLIDEAFVNENALVQEIIGNASANIPALKAHVKALYLRRFIAEKGIMPELQELIATDDDGKPQISIMDESIRHTEALVKSIVRTAAKTVPLADAATKDLDRITAGAQAEGSSGDTGSDENSGGDTGGDDLDADFGGGDDSTDLPEL